MSYRLPRYKFSLVRKGSAIAECNKIQTPDDVVVVMASEYAGAVETAQMPSVLTVKERQALIRHIQAAVVKIGVVTVP